MLKTHDELIEELAKSLTRQNYNPGVVANHRLYARRFLDYLAERDMPVAMVTPAQVDQYFRDAVRCFHDRYGRPPSLRWHKLPQTAIGRLLRLAQGTWPPGPEIEPGGALRHAICHDYEIWMRDERGLSDATIDARLREARRFLDWCCDRSGADGLQGVAIRDIDRYMDARAVGMRRISLAASAAWLRSLLRYLHQSGRVPADLSAQVISPMLYAYENVPSILERGQIEMVLETTGRDRSPRGLRDQPGHDVPPLRGGQRERRLRKRASLEIVKERGLTVPLACHRTFPTPKNTSSLLPDQKARCRSTPYS